MTQLDLAVQSPVLVETPTDIRARLPLHQKIELHVPTRQISVDGMAKVNRYLYDQFLPQTPEDFDPSWVVQRGEYAGTFPKRVSSYLYKVYGTKLAPEQMARIGDIARSYTDDQTTYLVDFDDGLDWHDGDFGDDGSCYWGGRSAARTALQEHNSRAIRFWDVDHPEEGYGRAWIVFPDPNWSPHLGDGACIVFNAYGHGLPLIRVARLLATYLGLSYKRISFENNGSCSDTLYINSGAGYLVGPNDVLQDITWADLHWSIPGAQTCTNCGCEIDEDDDYFEDSEWWCEDCHSSHFSRCDGCDDYYRSEDVWEVHSSSGFRYMCPSCRDEYAYCCAVCDEQWNEDDCTEVSGGDRVCPDCLEEHYQSCDECGAYHKKDSDEITETDNGPVCTTCLADYYRQCEGCGKYVKEEEQEGEIVDDRYFCSDGCVATQYQYCEDCGEHHPNGEDCPLRSECDEDEMPLAV